MPSVFKIQGVPPFDGEHPLDISYFTNRELHTIKRLSGVRAGELEEAFAASDTDLVMAFGVIALMRAGIAVPKEAEDVLWDAPLGSMQLVVEDDDEAAADVGPPDVRPEPGPAENATANNGSSGVASSNGSDPPANAPNPTGAPGSDSLASVLPISAT